MTKKLMFGQQAFQKKKRTNKERQISLKVLVA